MEVAPAPHRVPPWAQNLSDVAEKRATELLPRFKRAIHGGDWEVAADAAQELFCLGTTELGSGHPLTLRWEAWEQDLRRVMALDEPLRKELASAAADAQTADRVRGMNSREAIQLRKRARDVVARLLPESLLGAQFDHRLGEDLFTARQLEEAGTAFQASLHLTERRLGSRHPDVGDDCERLFVWAHQAGRYRDAEEFIRRALVVSAVAVGDRAVLTRRLTRYLVASASYPDEIRGRATVVWPNLLDEAISEFGSDLETLHYMYAAAGGLALSLDRSLSARTLFAKAVENLHPATAADQVLMAYYQNQLGTSLERAGRAGESVTRYREAERILAAVGQPNGTITDPGRLLRGVRHNIGIALTTQGCWEDADDQFRLVIEERTALVAEHLEVVGTLTERANNAVQAGWLDAAEAALDDAECRLTAEFVPSSSVIWIPIRTLRGQILSRRGRQAEAEAELRTGLKLMQDARRGKTVEAAVARCQLAQVLLLRWRLDEAADEARGSVKSLAGLRGEDHDLTAFARTILTAVLLQRGDLHDAHREAEAAWRVLFRSRGGEHAQTLAAGRVLAATLGGLGRTNEALALYRVLEAPTRRVTASNPDQLGQFLTEYAAFLGDLGDPDAERVWADALAIRWNNVSQAALTELTHVRHLLLRANSARPSERERLFRQATEVCDRCVRDTADCSDDWGTWFAARYWRAVCHQSSGELDHAERLMTALLASVRASDRFQERLIPHLRLQLGLVLLSKGRMADAETQFGIAVREMEALPPRFGPPSLFRFDPATRMNPGRYLAAVLAKRGRPREAFLALERGLARNLRDALSETARSELPNLATLQAAIPADAAVVAWVDAPEGRYGPTALRLACVIRQVGDPVWVELPGSGAGGIWTDGDHQDEQAYAALLTRGPRGIRAPTTGSNFDALRGGVARRRFEPILPHLAGTDRLPPTRRVMFVIPGPLSLIPLDALTDRYVVWGCHSLATLAAVRERTPIIASEGSVLVVGNPAYRPGGVRLAAAPAGGVLLTFVGPALARDVGIRPGDVVQSYGGTRVASPDDFEMALRAACERGIDRVSVTVWREGQSREVNSPRWETDFDYSRLPVREAVEEFRRREASLLRHVPPTPPPLAWAGAELRALRAIYDPEGTGRVRVVEGADATPTRVERELTDVEADAIVFAVHGRRDDLHPFRSALVLAPDPGVAGGYSELPAHRMTGRRVRARLAILGGCWTGAGKASAGEGPLGWAQVLLADGTGACIVSLWEADDLVTALLQTRFHLNRAGRRPGLDRPMPVAEALDEAKRWVRTLTPSEIGKLYNLLATDPAGLVTWRDPESRSAKAVPPYADPRYWAGFVLIGSPD